MAKTQIKARAVTFPGMHGIMIDDAAILRPGAKIPCKQGILTVGRGSAVRVKTVLLESTGENVIWRGIPARSVGMCDG